MDYSNVDPEVTFRPGRGDCPICDGYSPLCFKEHPDPDADCGFSSNVEPHKTKPLSVCAPAIDYGTLTGVESGINSA